MGYHTYYHYRLRNTLCLFMLPHHLSSWEMPKYSLFNARSEDAYKKPAFRDAFKSRRCLSPANGFYEWTKSDDGGKDPHYIHLPGEEPFSFAGLWAHNPVLDVTSCTILTAAAVDEIAHIHHRMPIILSQSAWPDWLDPSRGADGARDLLPAHRGHELVSHRVGRDVNSSRSEGPKLIEAL